MLDHVDFETAKDPVTGRDAKVVSAKQPRLEAAFANLVRKGLLVAHDDHEDEDHNPETRYEVAHGRVMAACLSRRMLGEDRRLIEDKRRAHASRVENAKNEQMAAALRLLDGADGKVAVTVLMVGPLLVRRNVDVHAVAQKSARSFRAQFGVMKRNARRPRGDSRTSRGAAAAHQQSPTRQASAQRTALVPTVLVFFPQVQGGWKERYCVLGRKRVDMSRTDVGTSLSRRPHFESLDGAARIVKRTSSRLEGSFP